MIPLRGMSPLVWYEVRDRVAVITVNNPPVNALSARIPEAISNAVERACDLSEGAIAFAGARAAAGERRGTRDLQHRIGDRAAGIAACQTMRATLHKTARVCGHRSPRWTPSRPALTMDFDGGSRREIELFADCVLPVESKASPLLEKLAMDGRGFYGDAA
jgi:hypothetical protein